ncbi:uncharacterized protein UDID_19170 [Ustilago sp. UG-2017a]|nr:uncharacterized protein UDID_19170 [Ustilago sp. UG-2017a]
MAVVQSPWRPWTPMDSHAKEERAHMRGGPATKRTKLKEQAQPRRGQSSRSRHSHEEDQAQGAGTATQRTKLKEQAQPRRGQSSRSRHSHEEDQAQGACRWLPLRGSRDKSQRNHHRSKGRSSAWETGKQVLRRRSSVEGVDTAQEDRGAKQAG